MKAMRDDLHVLTGSYALDAVSYAEREEFERHLQHCPTCEAEVRGLRETAARRRQVDPGGEQPGCWWLLMAPRPRRGGPRRGWWSGGPCRLRARR